LIIPRSHPRYLSLKTRERLVGGNRSGIVVPEGLIAHGRGEAFDYILGEKTGQYARNAITAAAAMLLTARKPVISVNGNTAALVPGELVKLAQAVGGDIEVNLFHRGSDREMKIARTLRHSGASRVLGVGREASSRVPGLASMRRKVDPSGIGDADVVVVPLEDGDRADALRRMGKKVIAVDLNPLSRTSRSANVTIVDNVTRALPLLIRDVRKLKRYPKRRLDRIVNGFDNEKNLILAVNEITSYLDKWNET
jgi:4-phosphopantoate--beta-alanine ligase